MGRPTGTACAALLWAAACAAPELNPTAVDVRLLDSTTTASLRGIAALSPQVAWISGSDGLCMRTLDGGRTFEKCTVPGAAARDFRDVHAFDRDTAVLLAVGRPAEIYRTEDGGRTWKLVHHDDRDGIFLDAIDFWDERRGVAFGDPIDGSFLALVTADGGRVWRRVKAPALPPPLRGEAGFAASGTCLRVAAAGKAWFVTGGGPHARLLHSTDHGATWRALAAPLPAGAASRGGFSVAVAGDRLVLVGGDYREPHHRADTVAASADGGQSWLSIATRPSGYRSAVTAVPGRNGTTFLAAGENGVDLSTDGGRSWQQVSSTGFHAIACGDERCAWAVGGKGRVALLEW